MLRDRERESEKRGGGEIEMWCLELYRPLQVTHDDDGWMTGEQMDG